MAKKKSAVVVARFRVSCPTCVANIGERHRKGCDIERCTVCGRQRMECSAVGAHKTHKPDRAAWTGYWPGELACLELGWLDQGVPDLNRWCTFVFKTLKGSKRKAPRKKPM